MRVLCFFFQMPNIKLQSSDGEVYDVDIEIAKQSVTIKTMLEGKAPEKENLTLKAPRKIIEQTTIYFYFLFFRENNAWHYMWIICQADDSHVMSSIISSEKYE